jgi:DNA-binding MarR family transcriptional regulator
VDLYDITRKQVCDTTRSPHAAQVVDALFDRPIFTAADIARRAEVPKSTIHKLINTLLGKGLLDTVRPAAGRSSAILTFAELLNTLEHKQLV